MFPLVQHNFWGKERLVKNRLNSTIEKVVFFKGTFFQGSSEDLFTLQNRVDIT
jgi:hypothetical protein